MSTIRGSTADDAASAVRIVSGGELEDIEETTPPPDDEDKKETSLDDTPITVTDLEHDTQQPYIQGMYATIVENHAGVYILHELST